MGKIPQWTRITVTTTTLCRLRSYVRMAPVMTSGRDSGDARSARHAGHPSTRHGRYHNIDNKMGQTSRRSRRRSEGTGDPFWDLVATARRLQGPDGCSWDRAQTVSSLLPCLVEETWEVFEAVRRRHHQDLAEELGDVLYTVIFLSLIAERQGRLRLDSLLRATQEKMIRRHPHVFAGQPAPTPDQAYRQWQMSKRREGARRHSPSKVLQKTLVAWWDWLRRHPDALTTSLPVPSAPGQRPAKRGISGGPRRPSARRVPAKGRSRVRGQNSASADGGMGTRNAP